MGRVTESGEEQRTSDGHAIGPGFKSWALYLGASFSLESSSSAFWPGSGPGDMLGQAAGHRLSVGLVSL